MMVMMAAMIAIVAASLIHVAHRREEPRCQGDQQGSRQNFIPGDSWPVMLEVTDNAWESCRLSTAALPTGWIHGRNRRGQIPSVFISPSRVALQRDVWL